MKLEEILLDYLELRKLYVEQKIRSNKMEKVYNVREFAKKLNISASYVYLLVRFNVIKPYKRRPLLFTDEEVRKYYNMFNEGEYGKTEENRS